MSPRASGGGALPPNLTDLFQSWAGSDLKARVLVFFNSNPGVIETLDGLALRIGANPESLRPEVEAHVAIGLITQREVGGKTIYRYNRQRRLEMERRVVEELRQRLAREADT